jgi:MtN3 and saliva related transmembrane protein
MVIVGIVQPLATLPLLYELYVTHAQDGSARSLTTWLIFFIASLLLLLYGLHNRRPAIYVGNGVGLVTNLLMMNGILMYAR